MKAIIVTSTMIVTMVAIWVVCFGFDLEVSMIGLGELSKMILFYIYSCLILFLPSLAWGGSTYKPTALSSLLLSWN